MSSAPESAMLQALREFGHAPLHADIPSGAAIELIEQIRKRVFMLTVFGSVVLDTIRTPNGVCAGALGGAATYAGISAGLFVKTGLLGAVGTDFPEEYRDMLAGRLDLQGLHTIKGRTFRYECRYDRTMTSRESLRTELNVLERFEPRVPDEYKKSRFVYLSNNDPEQNLAVMREFDNVKFSMCDTIDFWIAKKRDAVIRMIGETDAVIINDEEARLLTGEHNLVRCAKKMMEWGAGYVIIKKAEHGSLMFFEDAVFSSAGFVLEDVVDPTGAGDSFAGAMIGYMASRNSTGLSAIKRGITYGNMLGSFAVEGYGPEGLLKLKRTDIAKRVKAYQEMIRS